MQSTRCSRRTHEARGFQPIFDCHTAVLPHTSRLQKKHTNYEIDSTDDKREAQKNPVKSKSSRKGPFSTDGIRLYKNWPDALNLFYICQLLLLLTGSTRKRLYPQRPSSFWTSRGRRYLPISPPVLPSFLSHTGCGSPCQLLMLVDFHRILLTHALALSARQIF